MRPATIRDVATHAKVSVASVSRTLNGHSNVHPDTRERVLRAVRELKFVPNAAARSLSTALTNTLGVVMPDLHGEFFSELIRGMDGEASCAGYQLLLSTMHADPAMADQAIHAMRGRVDGLVMMAPQLDRDLLERLLPPSLPIVLINSVHDAHRPSFGVDNAAGAVEVARHLIGIGRRRLVHVTGPMSNIDAQARRSAFAAAVRALAPDAELTICNGDFAESSGESSVRDLFNRGVKFDAVFAANDMMALGAMQQCRALGMRVPEDVAIVGFDDIPLARYLGLTTIQVRVAELGARGVAHLLGQLRGKGLDASRTELEPHLIVRESTKGS